MKRSSRIILQVILCLPVFLMAPLAFGSIAMIFTRQFWSELTSGSFMEFAMSAMMPLAAIGSVALISSIFLSLKFVSTRPAFRYALIIGLFLGMLAVALGIAAAMNINSSHFRGTAYALGVIFAPTCLVAFGNIIKLYRCEYWNEW